MTVEARATLLKSAGTPSGPMRTAMVLACLLTTAFAGCTDGPDPSSPASDNDPTVVTAPDDYDYLDAPDPDGHVHDYWGGRTELVVMDESYPALNPFVGLTETGHVYQRLPDLEPGTIVPQGTGALRIQVDITEGVGHHTGPGDVVAWTPAGGDMIVLGPVNEPIHYPVSLQQADLPHQSISGWEFWMRFETGSPFVFNFNGRVDAHMVAVRGPDPLPVFPAHPDYWQNRTEIRLFERQMDTTAQVYYGPVIEGCSGLNACFNDVAPDDGILVPADASHIDVRARADVAGFPVTLRYHGADSLDWSEAAVVEDTADERVFRIPVETRGDSPYAETSLWEFRFRPESQAAAGTYTFSATVFKHPVVGPEPL